MSSLSGTPRAWANSRPGLAQVGALHQAVLTPRHEQPMGSSRMSRVPESPEHRTILDVKNFSPAVSQQCLLGVQLPRRQEITQGRSQSHERVMSRRVQGQACVEGILICREAGLVSAPTEQVGDKARVTVAPSSVAPARPGLDLTQGHKGLTSQLLPMHRTPGQKDSG